jgi:hypothetical protein
LVAAATSIPAHGENASNPFAAVSNTDIRLQYFDLDGPELYDFWAATPPWDRLSSLVLALGRGQNPAQSRSFLRS